MPQEIGGHSGEELEEAYFRMIQRIGLLPVHGHVTIYNASNNFTLFQAFFIRPKVVFDAQLQVHRYFAHFANLVVRDGIFAFGRPNLMTLEALETERQKAAAQNSMKYIVVFTSYFFSTDVYVVCSIVALVINPDAARVDIKSAYGRIKDLTTAIKSSPQRRSFFQSIVSLQQQKPIVNTLISSMTTRWNSTFAMFNRALARSRSYSLKISKI